MLGSMVPMPSAVNTIGEVMEIQKQYWSCLKSKVAIPSVRQVESQRWEREKSAMGGKRAKSRLVTEASNVSKNKRANAERTDKVTTCLKGTRVEAEGSHVTASVPNSACPVLSSLEAGLAGLSVSPETPESCSPLTAAARSAEDSLASSQMAATQAPANTNTSNTLSQGGARPKVKTAAPGRTLVKSTFVSSLGTQDPDSEPLSIFAQAGFKRSLPEADISGEEKQGLTSENKSQLKPDDKADSDRVGNNDRDGGSRSSGGGGGGSQDQASASGSSAGAGAEGGAGAGGSGGASVGAGGGRRPNTVEEFLQMQGGQQMFAVTPLSWCPHLSEVRPVPPTGLDSQAPCSSCGDISENWVCLTCYQVECSRFVNEHMLYHRLETDHNLVLSYSDISVWCYCCDHYVDNPALLEAKNAAHLSKFGESLPGTT